MFEQLVDRNWIGRSRGVSVVPNQRNSSRLASTVQDFKFFRLPSRRCRKSFVHHFFRGIYYLFLFSIAGFLIATIFNKKSRISDLLNDVFKKITLNFWLRLISSSFVVFICLYWMESIFLKTNNSFTIEWSVFFTYFMFYSTGWMFYRTDCLMQLSKNAWIQLAIATLLFLAVPFTPWPNETWVLTAQQILIAISTSLFVFGFFKQIVFRVPFGDKPMSDLGLIIALILMILLIIQINNKKLDFPLSCLKFF